MTAINNLSRLITELGVARQATSNAYEAYKELKSFEDQLRYELENELHTVGLKTAKGNDFTASLMETPRVIIKHEGSVINWLRNKPDIETDRYIGLKATEFQTFARTYLKGTGEIIPGTDIEIRESLSIRANKKGEK